MSAFADDLLRAASRLHARRAGQRGPLKSAYVRRSLSTTYYAIFHFCLEETSLRLVGTGNELRLRRRTYVRTLSHGGLTTAFGKLKGSHVDRSVEDLFRSSQNATGPVPTPDFVRRMATTYLDAKAKREDADYDLNALLSEADARQLRRRVIRALRAWRGATAPADRDAKHAVALLLSLRGRLRE